MPYLTIKRLLLIVLTVFFKDIVNRSYHIYPKVFRHISTRCMLANFSCYFFSNFSTQNILSMSNTLVPGQARHFVGHALDPNCLQRLSADGTSRLKLNLFHIYPKMRT